MLFERLLAVADLADKYAAFAQEFRRMMQDQLDRIQTIRTGCQSKRRLVQELCRARIHVSLIYVRRIADNEVVLDVIEVTEEIGLYEPHAILHAMRGYVDGGDLERIRRDINGIHDGIRERVGKRDRNAATAGAKIDHAFSVAIRKPRREALGDQLGNGRARHEYPLIHEITAPGEPSFIQQVGQRHTLVDPPPRKLGYGVLFGLANRSRVHRRGIRMFQLQCGEHQPGSFIERVIRTVAVVELRICKATRVFANQLFNIFSGCVRHLRESSTIPAANPVAKLVELPPPAFTEVCSMASLRPVIALILLLALGAGIYVALRMDSPPPQPTTATLLPASDPLPDVALTDHRGNAVGAEVFKGRWNLVFFGFTHCPDICPLTLQVLADARRQLRDAGIEDLPRIVLVSVDPERDTPESLANYLSHFGDDVLGLGGELAEIRKLTGALGIFFDKQMADASGNYGVDHSAVVLLMNPAGRLRALFSTPHTAENFVHDLPLIMSEAKATAGSAPLVVSDVTVTGSMPGMSMSAGYMTFTNNSGSDIRINRISSPQFAAVEMHETVIENDIARMRPIDAIVVPANDSASLQRGGKHLMLMQPSGTGNEVTLNIWSDDTLLLTVTTRIADR